MKIGLAIRSSLMSLAAMGMLAAFDAVATPAGAVPGLVRVSATSANDSVTTKSVSAACPAGTKVLGGGGEITNGAGQVLLTALEPVSASNSFLARGYEDDDGFAGNWQVTAYAVCASSPAGLEYRSQTGSPQSAPFGTYTAVQCSTGKHLLGLGGRTNNGNGDVVMEGIGPFDPQEVLVPGAEDPNGFAGMWSMTAHIVCANPITGRGSVFASTVSDSTSPKTVTVTCAAGKKVHGAGFSVGGNGAFGKFNIRSVTPNSTLTAVTASAEEIDGGVSDSWRVTAWAVCAP